MSALQLDAEEVFSAHLDLTALGHKRRGLARCIFHSPDKTPSLSVDLERGLFYCHGCHVGGGIKRFRELTGEPVATRSSAQRSRPESPLQEARRCVADEAERQRARLELFLDLYAIADAIRERACVVASVRRAVTEAGESPRAWDLLERTAGVERETWRVEAEVDAILAEGRIT